MDKWSEEALMCRYHLFLISGFQTEMHRTGHQCLTDVGIISSLLSRSFCFIAHKWLLLVTMHGIHGLRYQMYACVLVFVEVGQQDSSR